MKLSHSTSATLGLSLLALAASGCGLFGPPEPVAESHTGSLEAGDTVIESDGSFADDYTIQVQSGWTITAVMSAQGFDPYVWVIPPNSGGTTPPQQGSAPGTHVATMTHTAATSGRYTVRANSAGLHDVLWAAMAGHEDGLDRPQAHGDAAPALRHIDDRRQAMPMALALAG